jgi:4-hydroxybenzoate polyprenyltransferase
MPLLLRQRLRLYLDLIRWNRPAGWLLLLWPTLSALWIAAKGFPGWPLLLIFSAGTILMRSAGCCINDVADHDFDKHVQRTVHRPVTSGALAPREALLVGGVLACLAFALVLQTNVPTIQWSFAALAVACVYPYTKRFFAMPQAVLGIAFSMGIPMAYTAVQEPMGLQTWLLVCSNICWVLAYDTEYAMVDREDDLRIGIRTSAITLGRWDVRAIVVFYLAHLALWSWATAATLPRAWWLLWLFIAAAQVAWHAWLVRQRERAACFKAFRLNHWLGFTLFLCLVLRDAVAPLMGQA